MRHAARPLGHDEAAEAGPQGGQAPGGPAALGVRGWPWPGTARAATRPRPRPRPRACGPGLELEGADTGLASLAAEGTALPVRVLSRVPEVDGVVLGPVSQ